MAKLQMPEELRDYFRQAAARRKQDERTCGQCGKKMVGLATRRYCSIACRSKAQRERERPTRSQAVAGS
jgi:ribosomal protein L34E